VRQPPPFVRNWDGLAPRRVEPTRPATSRGFTLIEIMIAVFILMMLLLLAVPSLNGVLADKRLRRSLDRFNSLVHQAQERSVVEHRAYLIVWGDKSVAVRPESLAKGEEVRPTTDFPLPHGDVLKLVLPAALTKNPPGEWIFWPSGTCEPAVVQFSGRDGTWTVSYSALTARPELTNYAAR
jgi:prepilin-type N-terminal cleavage/methylation domain-containing protein